MSKSKGKGQVTKVHAVCREAANAGAPAQGVPRKAALWGLLLITAIGFAMRIYRLTAISFWNDEALQINGFTQPVGGLLDYLRRTEFMPPLSYLIQRSVWLPFQTDFTIRLPSALLGTALIPLSYWTASRIGDRVMGLTAAFLTSFSFFLVWYSQECRTYIFWAAALWLTLALWMNLRADVATRVPWWKWVLLCFSGILCGAFHFGTLAFLPVLGLAGAFHLTMALGPQRKWRTMFSRIACLAAALVIALAASYVVMRVSVNWAMFEGHGAKAGGYRPTSGEVASVLLKYSWGKGWPLVPFISLILCVCLCRERRTREISATVAVLALTTIVLYFYVRPLFSSHSKFLAASRYLFWLEWCVIMLQALGVHAIYQRMSGPRARLTLLSALVLVYMAILWRPFSLYYRMDAKTGNYAELKRAVERIDGTRLMVLGNGYDMQYIRHYWPTNCAHGSAPIYNNQSEYSTMRIREWTTTLSKLYPNIVLQINRLNNYADSTFPELSDIYAQDILISNGTEMVLYDMGINPNEPNLSKPYGVPMNLLFNRDEDLHNIAKREDSNLTLFPGHLSLLTTIDPAQGYKFWRVLDRPSVITCINPTATNRHHSLKFPIARLSQRGGVAFGPVGGRLDVQTVAPAYTTLFDAGNQRWVQQSLDLRTLASIASRIPAQIVVDHLERSVALRPGENLFHLVPRDTPWLIGPATPVETRTRH